MLQKTKTEGIKNKDEKNVACPIFFNKTKIREKIPPNREKQNAIFIQIGKFKTVSSNFNPLFIITSKHDTLYTYPPNSISAFKEKNKTMLKM